MRLGRGVRRWMVAAAEACGWLDIVDALLVSRYLERLQPTYAASVDGAPPPEQVDSSDKDERRRLLTPSRIPGPMVALDRFLDIGALVLALPIAFTLYVHLRGVGAVRFDAYWLPLLIIVLAWGAGAWVYRLYDGRTHSLHEQLRRVARTMTLVAFAVFAVIFFAQVQWLSHLLTGLYFVAALVLVAANRLLLRVMARVAGTSAGAIRYYAVVGSGELAFEIITRFRSHPEWGMTLAGLIVEDDAVKVDPSCIVLGRVGDLEKILEEHLLDDVVFAVARERLCTIEWALDVCEKQGVSTMMALDVVRFGNARMTVGDLDGLPMLAFARTPSDELALSAKRAFDVAMSFTVLILLSPVFLAVAIAIKLDSPGPVFMRQKRVGLQGRTFGLWKFRSMYLDAEERLAAFCSQNGVSRHAALRLSSDPRITRVGRFIRKTSLNEFPQFWNVLHGEMSVVGPRPLLPAEVRQFKRWQRRRLSVKPGMTLIRQITDRGNVDFDRWMQFDLQYIDQWSLWKDVMIVLQAVPAVLRPDSRSRIERMRFRERVLEFENSLEVPLFESSQSVPS